MLKEFFLKKMISSQLAGVSEEDKNKIIEIVSKNPELFRKIVQEAQEKMKDGKDQMSAIMEVASEHKEELQKSFKNES